MLTIRQQQMHAFERGIAEAMKDRIVSDLRTFWPHTCARIGPAVSAQQTAENIGLVNRYGITASRDVMRLANTLFAIRQNAPDQLARAEEILARVELHSSTRADMVFSLARTLLEGRDPDWDF